MKMTAWSTSLLAILALAQPAMAVDCYNSTYDVLLAQANDPLPDDQLKEYHFCPDLTIPIGFPTDGTFTNFVNGDFPLGVLRPNVTIHGHGVTLTGGLVKFATLAAYFFEGQLWQASKDDVTVYDVHFQGPSTPGGGAAGETMAVTAPGRNMHFVNIHVSDFDTTPGTHFCTTRPLFVGESGLPALIGLTPSNSIEVTFTNLTISDSSMIDCASFVAVENQTATFVNLQIDNSEGFAAFEAVGPDTDVTIDGGCFTNLSLNTTVLFYTSFPVVVASDIYIDSVTQDEQCSGEDGEWIGINEIPGDGFYSCDTLNSIVDTCGGTYTTMPPTTESPTMEPSSSLSMAGSAWMVLFITVAMSAVVVV